MITVHHLNNSRSQRVLWLLEELQVPYEVRRYQRDSKTMLAPPELKAIHPLGKSPILTDSGQVIAESGAIIEYLLEKYGEGRLRPAKGTPEALRFTYWLHYAEGSAMTPLLLSLIFTRMPKQPMPFFMKPLIQGISDKVMSAFVRPQVKLHMDYMESELTKFSWFAGPEFSAADIQMSFPVEGALTRGSQSYPRMADFLKRIQSRPAYQKAMEVGGPFELIS